MRAFEQVSIKDGHLNIYNGKKLLTSIKIDVDRFETLRYLIQNFSNPKGFDCRVNETLYYNGFIAYDSKYKAITYYKYKKHLIEKHRTKKHILTFKLVDDSFVECLTSLTKHYDIDEPIANKRSLLPTIIAVLLFGFVAYSLAKAFITDEWESLNDKIVNGSFLSIVVIGLLAYLFAKFITSDDLWLLLNSYYVVALLVFMSWFFYLIITFWFFIVIF